MTTPDIFRTYSLDYNHQIIHFYVKIFSTIIRLQFNTNNLFRSQRKFVVPLFGNFSRRYGMCVDYDECANQTICDNVSETCFNTPGNYVCACSYGHTWSTAKNQCRENERLTYATKRFGGIATPEEGRATTCHRLSLTVIVMCIASISITHHLYKG